MTTESDYPELTPAEGRGQTVAAVRALLDQDLAAFYATVVVNPITAALGLAGLTIAMAERSFEGREEFEAALEDMLRLPM
ncbi:MAG: hypothetical protein ACT4QG_09295 [Sporichthyaceae bacterium]